MMLLKLIFIIGIGDCIRDIHCDNEADEHIPEINELQSNTTQLEEATVYGNVTTLSNVTGDLKNESETFTRTAVDFKDFKTIIIIIVCGTLSVLTLAGNLLIIVAFYKTKKLQIINNYFLVSLAVADAAIGGLAMPLTTINLVFGHWPLGPVLCDVFVCLDYSLSGASVTHILVICLDRYWSVTKPLKYRVERTTKRVVVMLALVWIYSFFIPVSCVLLWPVVHGKRTIPEKQCYFVIFDNDIVSTILNAVIVYIPTAAIIFMYLKIYGVTKQIRKLRSGRSSKYVETDRSENSEASQRTEAMKVASIFRDSTQKRAVAETRNYRTDNTQQGDRAARILSVILLTFLITWMPMNLTSSIQPFCGACVPNVAWHYLSWLLLLNSTMNPFYYALCNPDFKMAFKRTLCCQK